MFFKGIFLCFSQGISQYVFVRDFRISFIRDCSYVLRRDFTFFLVGFNLASLRCHIVTLELDLKAFFLISSLKYQKYTATRYSIRKPLSQRLSELRHFS